MAHTQVVDEILGPFPRMDEAASDRLTTMLVEATVAWCVAAFATHSSPALS